MYAFSNTKDGNEICKVTIAVTLKPIRLASNKQVIDRAEYASPVGAYHYALDVMTQMEEYTQENHAIIHPRNKFYCPY